ncbi:MAG TPA: hypothetical protein VMF86_12965 [Stellaceae bacterium]|nr:hypothetical protein [Stellaceae bacterium]
MRRLLVMVAAIAVVGIAFAGGSAFADKLVPGGWLQPVQLPNPPPPAVAPAEAPPRRVEHRRERARERPPAPQPAPVTEGRVRF